MLASKCDTLTLQPDRRRILKVYLETRKKGNDSEKYAKKDTFTTYVTVKAPSLIEPTSTTVHLILHLLNL